MSKYNVAKGGKSLGKFTDEEIWKALGKGELSSQDLVWVAGWDGWQKIGDVPELRVGIVESSTLSALKQEEKRNAEIAQAMEAGLNGDLEEGDDSDTGGGSSYGKSSPESEEPMPAWERREELGVWQAFLWTVRDLFATPKLTFSRMPVTGGFGGPLMLAFMIGLVVFVITLGMQMALMTMGLVGQPPGGGGAGGPGGAGLPPEMLSASGVGFGVGFVVGALVVGAISLLIGPFISAAIFHVGLKLAGGANSGYEGTFRVYCYSYVVASLLTLVPCVGGLLAIVALAVWMVIGFSQVNSISVGRATLAFFLPVIVCCLCFFLLAFGMGALGSGQM